MGRLIAIGDLHGCVDEARQLLRLLGVGSDDRVVAVGDFVSKGPDVAGVVELWAESGFSAVLGNNDEKFLQAVAKGAEAVSAANRKLSERSDLCAWLAALPLQFDDRDLNLSVVHAGVAPRLIEETWDAAEIREARLRLRYLRSTGGSWERVRKGDERPSDIFWTKLWYEPRRIVFGHTPMETASVSANSIGIDTGCVYGGALTAAIFTSSFAEPEIVSVRAARPYAPRK